MRPTGRCPLGLVVLLSLSGWIVPGAADVCHTDQPLVNADFEISCLKYGHLEVEIVCKSRRPEAWSNLPSGRLGLSSVHTTTFRDCDFPAGLSLLNVTRSLAVNTNNTLRIKQARSGLRREHLSGFVIKTLSLYNPSPAEPAEDEAAAAAGSQLSADLLSEIEIEELLIENVPLRAIPAGFFRHSSGLRYLEITGAGLGAIRRDDLSPLEGLRDLLLFGNEIAAIELGSLDRLVHLKVCELSGNRLRGLPAGLFRKLARLEKLNLSENELEALEPDLLRIDAGGRLKRVRLNHNRGGLASLPPGFFRNLSSLSYVELTSNNFTSLPADLFVGAYSLTALNVSNNSLLLLPAKLFDGTSLTDLRASENQLASLPEGLFEDVSLERLYLNDNRLTNLSLGVLAGLTSLKILQLARNNLTYIEPYACNNLIKVEYVDLSHNQLTLVDHHAPYSVLLNCVYIIHLNLSYNRITQIFDDWKFNGNLKNLNLEGNKITHISASHFDVLNFEAELNLRNNEISTIDLAGLESKAKEYRSLNPNVSKNALVDLENNPLNCNCLLLDFFRYLERKMSPEVYTFVNIDAEGMRCAAPAELAGTSIAEIPSEELRCPASCQANSSCVCWRIPGKGVLSVDCSQRNLTVVPAIIDNPYNWSIELNMTGNRLRETPALNRSYLLNVTALDLSFNNLSLVTVDVFSEPLRVLKLHNNSISRLDIRVVQHLYDDELLRNLTLHGNRWICDCEARSLLTTVQKKLATFDLHEVRCRENNRRLAEVTVNELCEGAVAIIVVASLLIALCGIVLGCLAALYYRYQTEIKMWLYSKQWCLWFVTEYELDKDKLYDAFISFSHKDEEFVEREIVAKLEEGPRPYKLCLHYRDWLAGEWIPAQIARSVEESRRTIVILSPNFLESVWGRMEFRTAHNQALSEGRARVIVILYGEIGNTDQLDPELKAYLSMNTYVKWGDPWFWDKLRYALPHRHEARPRKRHSRNARIIENHLSQLPVNNHHHHHHADKAEIIPMPKITAQSNDSTKLLDSGAEDEKNIGVC